MDDFNMSQPIESNIHEACMNGETERFLNLINEVEHLEIVEIDQKRTLIFAVVNKDYASFQSSKLIKQKRIL